MVKQKLKKIYIWLFSDFQVIFNRAKKMFSNNVKETTIFCQCFHKFLLIYNNVCLEKHQPGIIKKTKKKLKKSSE